MTQTELLAELLTGNLDFVKMTLSDFSDADMLVRPCPGANHAAWQLGHLTNSESGSLALLAPDKARPAPAAFKEKFNKETAKIDDPKFFPGKGELIEAFSASRLATVEWAKSLTPADLARPTPDKVRSWAPTVGHLLAMTPVHVAMHVGQFQVIRRKLGKPVLF
jgi:hypothetical protein